MISLIELCDIHKSNQIESNSQLNKIVFTADNSCVISTKVIKLKAIHNLYYFQSLAHFAVWYPQK